MIDSLSLSLSLFLAHTFRTISLSTRGSRQPQKAVIWQIHHVLSRRLQAPYFRRWIFLFLASRLASPSLDPRRRGVSALHPSSPSLLPFFGSETRDEEHLLRRRFPMVQGQREREGERHAKVRGKLLRRLSLSCRHRHS